MNNIKDILNSIKMKTNSNDYYRIFETYNEAIDECIEELSKHNLVVCPTELEMTKLAEQHIENKNGFVSVNIGTYIKALLALLRKDNDK